MDKLNIQNILNELKEISQQVELEYFDELLSIEQMLEQNVFKIAVMGEFSVGKSTFLNAFIGKRVLYSSVNEATAVVTAIMNSQDKVAKVYFKNQSSISIDLEKDNSYEELESYLNINSEFDVEQVIIEYPFKDMDQGIILLDTPGLKGISEKQLEITKQAINTANATILLINEKGISQSELDLLIGANESFGKIKTKEIIIVINKIGEIIQKRGLEEGNKKIDEVKESVLTVLEEHNLSHIKVFELDSRDCLWGRDEKLYEQVKKSSLSKFSSILSQEEYYYQSRFAAFEKFLYSTFSSSQKEKMLLEEVSYRLSLIAKELDLLLSDNKTSNYNNLDKELKILRHKHDLVTANQRKLYNTTVRQLDELDRKMYELVQGKINNNEKNVQRQILDCIQANIQTLEDINLDTTKELFNYLDKILQVQIIDYEKRIKQFYTSIDGILSETFNEEFSRLFNQPAELKLNFDNIDFEVTGDLEFHSFEEESSLKLIDEEIGYLKEQVFKENEQLESLSTMNLKKQIQKIKKNQKQLEDQFKQQKQNLGRRPEPIQKYKDITKKKGIWIFSKTYIERVPDGLDYTPCKKWDEEIQNITKSYHKENNQLIEYSIRLENKAKQKGLLKKRIESLNEQLEQLKQIREHQFQLVKKRQEDYREQVLDDKKYEIYYWLIENMKRYHKEYLTELYKIMESFNLDIKSKIKITSDNFINQYKNQIENNIQDIYSELTNQKTSNENNIKKITKLIKLLNTEE